MALKYFSLTKNIPFETIYYYRVIFSHSLTRSSIWRFVKFVLWLEFVTKLDGSRFLLHLNLCVSVESSPSIFVHSSLFAARWIRFLFFLLGRTWRFQSESQNKKVCAFYCLMSFEWGVAKGCGDCQSCFQWIYHRSLSLSLCPALLCSLLFQPNHP